jgi:6-phosphogluconolactonase (cycloisomerase 2 family)
MLLNMMPLNHRTLALFAFFTTSVHVNAIPLSSGLNSLVSSAVLYVSSYAGQIQSLKLSQSNGAYSLTSLGSNYGCAPNASWLTLDGKTEILYCVNEALNGGNGSLSSYCLGPAGSGMLTQEGRITTLGGGVHSALFNNDSALVVPH